MTKHRFDQLKLGDEVTVLDVVLESGKEFRPASCLPFAKIIGIDSEAERVEIEVNYPWPQYCHHCGSYLSSPDKKFTFWAGRESLD